MDKLAHYREVIEEALQRIVELTESAHTKTPSLRDKAVLDRKVDSYLIVREGWDGPHHVSRIVVNLEILNDKIWIQEDWLEHGIAHLLEEAGVPKNEIVLGFQSPEIRSLTDYAAA